MAFQSLRIVAAGGRHLEEDLTAVCECAQGTWMNINNRNKLTCFELLECPLSGLLLCRFTCRLKARHVRRTGEVLRNLDAALDNDFSGVAPLTYVLPDFEASPSSLGDYGGGKLLFMSEQRFFGSTTARLFQEDMTGFVQDQGASGEQDAEDSAHEGRNSKFLLRTRPTWSGHCQDKLPRDWISSSSYWNSNLVVSLSIFDESLLICKDLTLASRLGRTWILLASGLWPRPWPSHQATGHKLNWPLCPPALNLRRMRPLSGGSV